MENWTMKTSNRVCRLAPLFAIAIYLFIFTDALATKISTPETVTISAGPFLMGSTREEREKAYQLDERAYKHRRTRDWKWYESEVHARITLPAYRITKTPITNRHYATFIDATKHPAPSIDERTWRSYKLVHPYQRTRKFAWENSTPPKGRLDHPVVLVSYLDARAYAAWLSEETGQRWRLPTEPEWEKASRGTDGRLFPWGNSFAPRHLNSHDLGPFDTVAVGQFPKGKSPFGLLDSAGQVFEWTQTASTTGRHIVKGGSWDDKGCGVCRPAARHSRPDHLKHILIGFRLVVEIR